MAMTKARQVFADEYIKDLNGTRAYMVAYPRVKKDTVAATNAGRLLRIAEVKNYIDEQLERMHSERSADAQEVIEYLTRVMRSQETETVITPKGLAIDDVPPKISDKNRAAELLGKRHGLFTDNVNLTGSDIKITIGGDDDDN
ncbi:terminase small subunit [Loigolactobacillus backii]|uniref:terminase small subunit n=1 Tax=Loigolactobacillus backii TaxID=375175 RepID=UPI0022FD3C2E|nr:terminase small subunit [Loigolactobacillus backii]MDA5386965.1 terminase small subunit [Loigolactobacillus backii]MDA5389503.1 terminase small subunit [Loigolactobacillus backii]